MFRFKLKLLTFWKIYKESLESLTFSLPMIWPLALNFWGMGTAEFRLFSLLREVK